MAEIMNNETVSKKAETINPNQKPFLDNEFPQSGMWRMIVDHLLSVKEPAFQEKLRKSTQTFDQLKKYINDQAWEYIRKRGDKTDGWIDNEIVYGWAIHFIDENIRPEVYRQPLVRTTTTPNTSKPGNKSNKLVREYKAAYKKPDDEKKPRQLSLFDDFLASENGPELVK